MTYIIFQHGLNNIDVNGQNHVGCLCGVSKNVYIYNITIEHSIVRGSGSVGVLVGTAVSSIMHNIHFNNISSQYEDHVNGIIVGTMVASQLLGIENGV